MGDSLEDFEAEMDVLELYRCDLTLACARSWKSRGYWITAEQQTIAYHDMTISHILNCIAMLEKQNYLYGIRSSDWIKDLEEELEARRNRECAMDGTVDVEEKD